MLILVSLEWRILNLKILKTEFGLHFLVSLVKKGDVSYISFFLYKISDKYHKIGICSLLLGANSISIMRLQRGYIHFI